MTTYRIRAAVALVLAAFAASACGDDSGSGGPDYADSVSTAQAEDVANSAASTLTWAAQSTNFGGPSYGLSAPLPMSVMGRPEVVAAQARSRHLRPVDPARFGIQAALRQAVAGQGGPQLVDDGCTYSGHGFWDNNEYEWIDNNNNDLPDDVLFEYKCTEDDGDGAYYTWSERLTIKEVAGSLWGFTLSWKYVDRWDSGDGEFEVDTYEQTTNVDIRAGSAKNAQNFKWTYAERYSGENWEEGSGDSWSVDFDPDATIVLGDDLPDGEMTLTGRRYYFETEGVSLSFALSTPVVLSYSAACADENNNPPFMDGVLHGELNGNSNSASFDLEFIGCGSYTIDVDGAYDEPMEAVAGRR